MALLIELPPELEAELTAEANRAGVAASERAALLLKVMNALTREGRKSALNGMVQAYLKQNDIDADHLADIIENLKVICLEPKQPIDRETVVSEFSRAAWVALPQDVREARVAALRGSLAHIGFSSEDHAREKQIEIDLEDRH